MLPMLTATSTEYGNVNSKKKYDRALKELALMKSITSKATERMSFYYNWDDLPGFVQSDRHLLERWIDTLKSDGVIIHDMIHGVH